MSDQNRFKLLKWLKIIVIYELKKLAPKSPTISRGAIQTIAEFVLAAVSDLVRRAKIYRSDRIDDELSSGEESSSSDDLSGESLEIEDVTQAYRDLEDYYALTGPDDESLFSQLAHPEQVNWRDNRKMLEMSYNFSVHLLSRFSGVKEWGESVGAFFFIYAGLLSEELLRESIALMDRRSKVISEDDAKAAVEERGVTG